MSYLNSPWTLHAFFLVMSAVSSPSAFAMGYLNCDSEDRVVTLVTDWFTEERPSDVYIRVKDDVAQIELYEWVTISGDVVVDGKVIPGSPTTVLQERKNVKSSSLIDFDSKEIELEMSEEKTFVKIKGLPSSLRVTKKFAGTENEEVTATFTAEITSSVGAGKPFPMPCTFNLVP